MVVVVDAVVDVVAGVVVDCVVVFVRRNTPVGSVVEHQLLEPRVGGLEPLEVKLELIGEKLEPKEGPAQGHAETEGWTEFVVAVADIRALLGRDTDSQLGCGCHLGFASFVVVVDGSRVIDTFFTLYLIFIFAESNVNILAGFFFLLV